MYRIQTIIYIIIYKYIVHNVITLKPLPECNLEGRNYIINCVPVYLYLFKYETFRIIFGILYITFSIKFVLLALIYPKIRNIIVFVQLASKLYIACLIISSYG